MLVYSVSAAGSGFCTIPRNCHLAFYSVQNFVIIILFYITSTHIFARNCQAQCSAIQQLQVYLQYKYNIVRVSLHDNRLNTVVLGMVG